MLCYQKTPIEEIKDPVLAKAKVRLLIKREDQNHPYVSGNKWWKLKYNLHEAVSQQHRKLLTFGGAYSNHIYATAAAAKECGLKSIGIIRGEETLPLNPTLSFAKSNGMQLYYVTRETYRKKGENFFLDNLKREFGNFYLIPEGGSNELAVEGVKEFARSLLEIPFNYVCVPVGTGGTLAGLIEGLEGRRNVIGFSALKNGDFLYEEVRSFLKTNTNDELSNWTLKTAYHYGGYAKMTKKLLAFLRKFEMDHHILLDPVYTGKMIRGVFECVQEGVFPIDATILCVHTGGLQGWDGIEQRGKELF